MQENRKFINQDFILGTKTAQKLYHDYAEDMPIIDYHCHLNPADIANDQRWDNIAQVWLAGDHYKWRAMRSNGVDENLCTGDASDREKFNAWAATMPYLLRNPLYHWTHLELARYFDVDDVQLSPETADRIWNQCNEKLAQHNFSAKGLIRQSRVKMICTTDDPVDSLEHHKAIAADNPGFQVLPTWRPDQGMKVENPASFNDWVDKLAAASDTEISDFDSYLSAIKTRHDYFHNVGCRISDHGIETFYAADYSDAEIKTAFFDLRAGKELSAKDVEKFKSAMMFHFGVMDAERDWVQQLHYGCIRNNNSHAFKTLGPDTGFDSIGDFTSAQAMSRYLDRLNAAGHLPKTIIYNLNPTDNAVVATMLGNFQDGSVPGKIQMGSGWWFLDQKDGIERQIESLSQLGLLSRFVGMLTDSRSFLSYTRHEYFRRILCNVLGNDMEAGLVPYDFDLVGRMVQDISYNNANNYFGFNLS